MLGHLVGLTRGVVRKSDLPLILGLGRLTDGHTDRVARTDGERDRVGGLWQGFDPRLVLRRAGAGDSLLGTGLDQVSCVDAADTDPGRVGASRGIRCELWHGPRTADGGVSPARRG